jgi:uncharacterized membrane protein
MVLWVGSLFTVYWLLRIHAHAPKDALDRLTLMERSMAMLMDIAATVTIGCGLVLALDPDKPGTWFNAHLYGPWLHIKLVIVVLGLLPVHGMIRGRVARFSRGQIGPVPAWQWSMLLASVMAIIVIATTKLVGFD